MKALFGWLILAIVAIFSVATARATSIPLYSFNGGSDGQFPYAGMVQGSDGNFYGTTAGYFYAMYTSSTYGTVFKITSDGNLTTLYSFSGSDGAYPFAGLVQGRDGNFYGTTSSGGIGNYGTVFKITSGGSLTTLYSFNLIDGAQPMAGLVQASDGNFYGTTYRGGTNFASNYPDGYGTVFKITSSGSLTTLHSFSSSDGKFPQAGLVQGSDGNFYGTTLSGGTSSGSGTVFKITSSGSLTTLHGFGGGYDGDLPYAGLVQGSDGNFYGTNSDGGAGAAGTVFKITSGGSITTLYAFNTNGDDGGFPVAGLVQGSDGNFYGTTMLGTVFKMTPDGSLTTLYRFSGSDGIQPRAGLVQGSGGNFYGTTSYGGASLGLALGGWFNGYGTVFKLTVMFVPTNADQCKDGGWATFTGPFKNQGDCIQFVNTGK